MKKVSIKVTKDYEPIYIVNDEKEKIVKFPEINDLIGAVYYNDNCEIELLDLVELNAKDIKFLLECDNANLKEFGNQLLFKYLIQYEDECGDYDGDIELPSIDRNKNFNLAKYLILNYCGGE